MSRWLSLPQASDVWQILDSCLERAGIPLWMASSSLWQVNVFMVRQREAAWDLEREREEIEEMQQLYLRIRRDQGYRSPAYPGMGPDWSSDDS